MLRFFTILTLLFLVAPSRSLVAATDLDNISFFRAIQGRDTYAKDPAKYDRVVIKDVTAEREYYIERQPAHSIPGSAIESIIVRKTKIYGSDRKEIEDAVRETLEGKQPRDFHRGFFYSVTFKIKAPASKRFTVFTEKNKQQRFRARIGKRNVDVIEFDLPFEVDASGTLEMTFYLQEDDANKIKEMLSLIKTNVVWE